MVTKTKKVVQIPRDKWDKMKANPAFSDVMELLEDISDLENAKKVKGKGISLDNYLKKRAISDNN